MASERPQRKRPAEGSCPIEMCLRARSSYCIRLIACTSPRSLTSTHRACFRCVTSLTNAASLRRSDDDIPRGPKTVIEVAALIVPVACSFFYFPMNLEERLEIAIGSSLISTALILSRDRLPRSSKYRRPGALCINQRERRRIDLLSCFIDGKLKQKTLGIESVSCGRCCRLVI